MTLKSIALMAIAGATLAAPAMEWNVDKSHTEATSSATSSPGHQLRRVRRRVRLRPGRPRGLGRIKGPVASRPREQHRPRAHLTDGRSTPRPTRGITFEMPEILPGWVRTSSSSAARRAHQAEGTKTVAAVRPFGDRTARRRCVRGRAGPCVLRRGGGGRRSPRRAPLRRRDSKLGGAATTAVIGADVDSGGGLDGRRGASRTRAVDDSAAVHRLARRRRLPLIAARRPPPPPAGRPPRARAVSAASKCAASSARAAAADISAAAFSCSSGLNISIRSPPSIVPRGLLGLKPIVRDDGDARSRRRASPSPRPRAAPPPPPPRHPGCLARRCAHRDVTRPVTLGASGRRRTRTSSRTPPARVDSAARSWTEP